MEWEGRVSSSSPLFCWLEHARVIHVRGILHCYAMCYPMHCIIHLKDSGTSSIRWYGLFRSKWTLPSGRMGPAVSGSVSGFFEFAQILAGHLRGKWLANNVTTFCLSAKQTQSYWFLQFYCLLTALTDRHVEHDIVGVVNGNPKIHWGHRWSVSNSSA